VRSRSSPRKLATESELYTSALRALMRRAHSIHEMREYLDRRAEDKDLVSPVVAKLRERGYIDDARYALEFARQHANPRRQGRFRIARELRARGLQDQHIEAALDAVFAETDEAALVRARLQKRLASGRAKGSQATGPLDRRKLASLYGSLLRAGFSSDVVRSELRALTRASAEQLPEIPANDD